MTAWSNPAYQFAQNSRHTLPPDFKHGIDLSLGHLIEMRNNPIISWLAPESRVKTNRVGGFRSRFKGRGMDFDESRLYQIGDDIRNIDWKVTARTGEAHTKIFKEERERPVFVVLDQMPSMFFGTQKAFKSVIACKIAAQLMWNTLSNGDRFGALLFGKNNHLEMKPSSNRRNCMRLLNNIVESNQKRLEEVFGEMHKSADEAQKLEQSDYNPLSKTLERLNYLAKPGTLVHIISDFNLFDEQCQRHLSKVSQHVDIHCILIKDVIEKDLPPPGVYGITDGLKNGLLDTANAKLRQAYSRAFAEKESQIKRFALSHRGVYTDVDTNYQQSSYGHQITSANSQNQNNKTGSGQ